MLSRVSEQTQVPLHECSLWASRAAIVLCSALGLGQIARADVGIRDFADTILIDDPEPSDQLVLPTVTWQRFGATDEEGPSSQVNLEFEIEKRITPRFGIQLGYGGSIVFMPGDSAGAGFQNLTLGAQFEAYRQSHHEFIVSLGVLHEFGNTGTARVGAESTGNTAPVIFLGKPARQTPRPGPQQTTESRTAGSGVFLYNTRSAISIGRSSDSSCRNGWMI